MVLEDCGVEGEGGRCVERGETVEGKGCVVERIRLWRIIVDRHFGVGLACVCLTSSCSFSLLSFGLWSRFGRRVDALFSCLPLMMRKAKRFCHLLQELTRTSHFSIAI